MTTAYLIEDETRDVPTMLFPGSNIDSPSNAGSHRALTLLGSDMCGAWTDNRSHFRDVKEMGVLRCINVWWLDIEGTIPSNIPKGRWEVELLLCYRYAPNKKIDWIVSVEGHNTDNPPSIHLRTGVCTGNGFDRRQDGTWVRYRMGDLDVKVDGCKAKLQIRGTGPQYFDFCAFGGLQLKPWSVGWKKEATLLRMLGKGQAEVETPKRHVDGNIKESRRHGGLCPCLHMPRGVVIKIAQFLITPLPMENLLLHED